MQFFMSCLFANIKTAAFRRSWQRTSRVEGEGRRPRTIHHFSDINVYRNGKCWEMPSLQTTFCYWTDKFYIMNLHHFNLTQRFSWTVFVNICKGTQERPKVRPQSMRSICVSLDWTKVWWLCVTGCYLMSQHPVELLFRNDQPLSVRAVHHQDDKLWGGVGGRDHTQRPPLKKTFAAAHGRHSGWAADSHNGCCC